MFGQGWVHLVNMGGSQGTLSALTELTWEDESREKGRGTRVLAQGPGADAVAHRGPQIGYALALDLGAVFSC